MEPTEAQLSAVNEQAKIIETGGMTGTECAGLHSFNIDHQNPDGSVEACFTYVRHDGRYGCERSTYSLNGVCIDSQDFG